MDNQTISEASRLRNRLHQLGGAVQDAQLNFYLDGFLEVPSIKRELAEIQREWIEIKGMVNIEKNNGGEE